MMKNKNPTGAVLSVLTIVMAAVSVTLASCRVAVRDRETDPVPFPAALSEPSGEEGSTEGRPGVGTVGVTLPSLTSPVLTEPAITSPETTGSDDPAPAPIAEWVDLSKSGPAIADRLTAGENGHSLALTGGTVLQTAAISVGTLSEVRPVLRFPGTGAAAEWVMDLRYPVPDDPADPILLAVTEIHEENEQTLAYTVSVDGRAVYFRTYGQTAAAPNQYYILLDRTEISDLSAVRIRVESASRTAFSIASVIAYTDLFGTAEKEGLDTVMTLYLQSGESVSTASSHLADFAGHTYRLYRTGLLFRLDYLNKTEADAVSSLESFLKLAGQYGVDLQIMPTVYWGQPNVPDGLGGYFTDAKYQQIAYDSVDGRFYGTFPNVYSSTLWVTSGSDRLNAACQAKIGSIFSSFRGLLSDYRATGRFQNLVSIVMEHGVCYKGMSTSTGYAYAALDGSDFGPNMIEKARADGVILDPTDGVSHEEKMWLVNHHAVYNQGLADAYRGALGSDAILVSGDTVTYPVSQTVDNIFTHGVQWTERTPANGDALASGWKSGVGTGMYSSSEDMYWDDPRFYQYKAALGRVGTVNFEVSYSKSRDLNELLRKGYELGFEFLTLFNDSSSYGTADIVQALDDIDSEAASYTVNHYDRPLLDADFNRDAAVSDWRARYGVVSAENVTYDTKNGVLKLASGSGTGTVVFRVTDGGDAFVNGLRAETESKGHAVLYAGTSSTVSSQTSYGRLTYSGAQNYVNSFAATRLDLTAPSKGRSDFYVTLELYGTATVKALRVYSVLPASGQQNGMAVTRREARILSLWTQKQQLAGHMLALYGEKTGERDQVVLTAETLIAEGRYLTAYELLSQAYSEALPAVFAVETGGRLGSYPISVTLGAGNAAQITLTSVGPTGLSFSASAEATSGEGALRADFTVTGLSDGAFTLTETGYNQYKLRKAAGGLLRAEGGALTFTVTIARGGEPVRYPHTVTGRVSSAYNTVITLAVQDPAVSGWSQRVTFPIASHCARARRADGSAETTAENAKDGDYAILTFNEAGTEVIAIEAIYGSASGTVRRYLAPDYTDPETDNGLVQLTDGRLFELDYLSYSTLIVSDGSSKRAREYTDAELESLLTGKTVTLTYCPADEGTYRRIIRLEISE